MYLYQHHHHRLSYTHALAIFSTTNVTYGQSLPAPLLTALIASAAAMQSPPPRVWIKSYPSTPCPPGNTSKRCRNRPQWLSPPRRLLVALLGETLHLDDKPPHESRSSVPLDVPPCGNFCIEFVNDDYVVHVTQPTRLQAAEEKAPSTLTAAGETAHIYLLPRWDLRLSWRGVIDGVQREMIQDQHVTSVGGVGEEEERNKS